MTGKIKELMCGDYIYDNSRVESRVCRVTGINLYSDSDMSSVEVMPLCSPNNRVKLLDIEIAPIRLTKEMLLTNGWRDDLTLPYEKKNYYYNGLKLYPYGPAWVVTYSGNNRCSILYVHQLQRIMEALCVNGRTEFKLEEKQ